MKKQAFFLAIALALHYMLDNIGCGSAKSMKKLAFFLAIALALHYICTEICFDH